MREKLTLTSVLTDDPLYYVLVAKLLSYPGSPARAD